MRKLLLAICLSGIVSLAFGQLNSDLVAYWPLDGNANDISGNGHHGIMKGNMTITKNRFGSSGCALSTSSKNSFISIPTDVLLDSTKGLSVSFWSKTIPIVDSNYLFAGNSYMELDNLAIWLDSNTTMAVRDFRENQAPFPLCSLWVNLNEIKGDYNLLNCSSRWNHVVIIYKKVVNNKYDFEVYKDNIKLNNIGSPLSNGFRNKLKNILLAKNRSFYVWDDVDLTDKMSYEYSLDDFRIYNRELSSSEINQLYSLQSNCIVTSLEDVNQQSENKTLIKITTSLGQDIKLVDMQEGNLYIYLYSDGSTKKVIQTEPATFSRTES